MIKNSMCVILLYCYNSLVKMTYKTSNLTGNFTNFNQPTSIYVINSTRSFRMDFVGKTTD